MFWKIGISAFSYFFGRQNYHYISDIFLPLAHLMILTDSVVKKDKFFSNSMTRKKLWFNSANQ